MAKVPEHPIETEAGLAKPFQSVHNSGPVRMIAAGEFKASPGIHCSFCAYRSLCPEKEKRIPRKTPTALKSS